MFNNMTTKTNEELKDMAMGMILTGNTYEAIDYILTQKDKETALAVEKERERIREAIETMEMQESPPFRADDTFRRQADLINQHLMPHIKQRFISLLTPQ